MVAVFCLRLAAGMILMLPILAPAPIPPRFYRVHFLTALGLLAVAAVFIGAVAPFGFWIAFAAAAGVCVVGSIVWHLDKAPGGMVTIIAAPVALATCLIWGGRLARDDADSPPRIADDVLGSLVVGSTTTAMLMGHSYLISPAMTIAPLLRLIAAIGVSIALRIGLSCIGLWGWTSTPSTGGLETELLVWLPVRWTLGLIAPLVLGWMAWEAARIRSTQSATGILYVVVVVSFLGELTSQLLIEKTGFTI